MASLSAYSPALTATSSTSRAHTDIDNLPDLDIAMDGVGVPDINDLFNFDEYESANDSHSTMTLSPNRTPSPHLAPHSPIAIAGSPGFNYSTEIDFSSFDFMNEKEIDPFNLSNPIDGIAGPSSFPSYSSAPISQPDIIVKSEPIDQWADQPITGLTVQATATPATQPLAGSSTPLNFDGLPFEQQVALQQLMFNMMQYQTKFGFDSAAAMTGFATPTPVEQPTTVEPSMLFSASGSTSARSIFSSAAPNGGTGLASSSGSTPGLTVGGSNSASSAPSVSTAAPTPRTSTSRHEDEEDDEEALVSVEPHEQRSTRADSAFSYGADDNLDSLSRFERLAPLSSIFSAGKGKGGKKGGGLSSVVRGEDEDVDDDDSWRPSPEEYKKLSSKEKRQLRNKLSARAFRNRRKDYIGTLEGHIKERDGVIDEMRSELVSSRTENQDLRKELEALKASTMGILHPKSAHDTASPAILQAFSLQPNINLPSATAGPSQMKKSAPTPVFNPRKDIGIDSKTRWGNENLFGGGSTICHTILTPDLAAAAVAPFDMPRANLNPRLSTPSSSVPTPRSVPNLQASADGNDLGNSSFAEWSEDNAWSIRSMDSYRMQMWGRLAREAASDKAGLVGSVRPRFLVESPDSTESSTTAQLTSKLAASIWSAFQSPSRVDTDRLTAVVTGKSRIGVGMEDEADKAQDEMIAALSGLRLATGKDAAWRETPTTGSRVREDPMRALGSLFGLGHGIGMSVSTRG